MLRGAGKTVLLNRIRSIAEEDGFRAMFIEAHESKLHDRTKGKSEGWGV
jgi:molybdopterin-guanine dinucleotide biosynthesis protein